MTDQPLPLALQQLALLQLALAQVWSCPSDTFDCFDSHYVIRGLHKLVTLFCFAQNPSLG